MNFDRLERSGQFVGLALGEEDPSISQVVLQFRNWRLVRGRDDVRSPCQQQDERDLSRLRSPPEFIRSDNGAEFTAEKLRAWIAAVGAKTGFIAPGSPWENGYCESFNSRFRDELLNTEVCFTSREAQILIERWRRHYNTVRPHSSPGYRPPSPENFVTVDQRPIMHQQSNRTIRWGHATLVVRRKVDRSRLH